MRLPRLHGMIDQRILVNYRVDPDVLAELLPVPFRPTIIGGYGLAGLCLIQLTQLRPFRLPCWMGLSSMNAAHRIAVEWADHGIDREGVYIPRRDTDSRWNSLIGGRLFPGYHHHARIESWHNEDQHRIALCCDDGAADLSMQGHRCEKMQATSVFESLDEAAEFFLSRPLGYSATRNPRRFDGLTLRCCNPQVEALNVTQIHSAYFDDESRFPPGSIAFDCALIMRHMPIEFECEDDLVVETDVSMFDESRHARSCV